MARPVAALSASIAACGGGSASNSSSATNTHSESGDDGEGSGIATSTQAAANADVVLASAIQNNVGGMGALQGRYTQQQILDITAYLATPGI